MLIQTVGYWLENFIWMWWTGAKNWWHLTWLPRKDLLTSLSQETPSEGEPICGTKHQDHVFIPSTKGRSLLTQFATATKPLTEDEFHGMLANFVTQSHLIPLKEFIDAGNYQQGYVAPKKHQSFLKDLARNNPPQLSSRVLLMNS